MLQKRTLHFDQSKTFSVKYKSMRELGYGLFTKFIENYCHLRLLSEFIQTQKRYPTTTDKIVILT